MIGCGIVFILLAFFSKEKTTSEVKTSLVFIGVLLILASLLDGLTHIHSISFSSTTVYYIRHAYHFLVGMAFGIILALKSFGKKV
jgi:hypothetical protein